MRKFTLLASATLAFLLPAVATSKHATASATRDVAPTRHVAHQRHCARLFTVHMGERAASAIYRGTRAPTKHQLKLLSYIERCQRNPAATWFVRWYDRREARRHAARRIALAHDTAFAYGEWAIPPSIVQCESHFQNLPPNSAGASGYYQIIPSTWQSYGGGSYAPEAYEATKYQQGVIAARIWDGGRGSGQWVCKAS